MGARIFIVEDDAALREELSYLLELSGFTALACTQFKGAAQEVLASAPDCVLMDLSLPGTSGHELCRDIRAVSDVPIIMLTSSQREFDEVLSMNLGADDYVTKPYSPAVLVARIQSVLRRSTKSSASLVLEHSGVRLDVGAGTISYEGHTAELTRNELKILHVLMRNPGVVISRAEIMCDLWESDAFIDDNTLTVNVNRLRKTLAGLGVPEGFLVTRRGQGYQVW